MGKVGRPKKKNAVMPGELKESLCRFTFITDKNIIAAIRKIAAAKNTSIKDYMSNILSNVPEIKKETRKYTKPIVNGEPVKRIRSISIQNQNKLKTYLAANKKGG